MLRVCSSFEYVVEKFGCPKVIAEIGVRGGHNAKGILTKYSDITTMVLIDRYKSYSDEEVGYIKQETHIANLRHMIGEILEFGDKIVFYPTDSISASKKLPNNYFDFVYLDDDHAYEAVKNGILHWYPKVKSGGFLAGHDYNREQVQRAVSEFVEEGMAIELIIPDTIIENKRIPDWVLQKNE